MKNSIKKKAVYGLIWSMAEMFSTRLISLIIQIILARLLSPSDFGIIAMITVIVAVSQSLVDGGFQNALIREKKPTDNDFFTVFLTNLFFSILIYAILFFLSPQIAQLYDNDKLIPVIRITSISLILSALSLVQRTKLTIELNFKSQTNISLISSIVSGIIAIILAVLNFNYWSLVIQSVSLQLVTMILLWIHNKGIPSGKFSKESFFRLFNFGWKLSLSGLINTIYDNLYYLIIGKIFNPTAVGYYTNAQKFRDVISQSLTTSIQKVTYPTLSKMQEDIKVLKNSYRKIIMYSSLFIFPVMVGLTSVAPKLFMLLFGEKWTNSIPIFQVLLVAGMIYPINAINLNILQVKGRSDLFLKIEIIKKVVGLFFIFLGIIMNVSVTGFAWISVLVAVISLFINSIYTNRIINYPLKRQLTDIIPYLICSIILYICSSFIGKVLSGSVIFILCIQVLVGVSSYTISIFFIRREDFKYFINMIKGVLINGK